MSFEKLDLKLENNMLTVVATIEKLKNKEAVKVYYTKEIAEALRKEGYSNLKPLVTTSITNDNLHPDQSRTGTWVFEVPPKPKAPKAPKTNTKTKKG